jgi:hypothetical protein
MSDEIQKLTVPLLINGWRRVRHRVLIIHGYILTKQTRFRLSRLNSAIARFNSVVLPAPDGPVRK